MQTLANDYRALKHCQAQLMKQYGDYSQIETDENLKHKLQKIHETLELLKYRLTVEKDYLMKERWETQSLYSIPQTNPLAYSPSAYYPPQSCYKLPVTYEYYPAVDWTSYLITPSYDYEYCSEPFCNAHSYSSRDVQRQPARDPATMKLYRGHLQDIERMCDEELANMENSMVHLRKIRKDWNCYELNAITPEHYKKRKSRMQRRKMYYYGNEYN